MTEPVVITMWQQSTKLANLIRRPAQFLQAYRTNVSLADGLNFSNLFSVNLKMILSSDER